MTQTVNLTAWKTQDKMRRKKEEIWVGTKTSGLTTCNHSEMLKDKPMEHLQQQNCSIRFSREPCGRVP